MYQEIKKLAEEALKLQNKNFMDETFKKIIAVCDEAACASQCVQVTYGEAKSYATEAEMVADIQGVASPVIGVDYGAPNENPAVLDERPSKNVLGDRNAEADKIVTQAVRAKKGGAK